jgi:hypothetical protein
MKSKEQFENEIRPIVNNLNVLTDYVVSSCEQAVEEELKVEHILSGIDELAKEWFKEFGKMPLPFPFEEMYRRISDNFKPSRGLGKLSKQNWRFEKKPDLAAHNKSLEKVLEKKMSEYADHRWANQVPAASGFCGTGGRKRSIDLVFKSDDSTFVIFYELKVLPESGNALSAAIELLGYGLLYIYTRTHLGEYEDSPYMKARTVSLRVLGTRNYYQRQACKSTDATKELENEISLNLNKFASTKLLDCTMDFGFYVFPDTFVWTEEDVKDLRDDAKRNDIRAKIVAAINGIDRLI